MSATTIIDAAPLGALIRYTDGSPKPPARFTKKLAAWERSNGVGRLVKKEPPRSYPTWTAPASFTLHEGNFSSDGVILVTITLIYVLYALSTLLKQYEVIGLSFAITAFVIGSALLLLSAYWHSSRVHLLRLLPPTVQSRLARTNEIL